MWGLGVGGLINRHQQVALLSGRCPGGPWVFPFRWLRPYLGLPRTPFSSPALQDSEGFGVSIIDGGDGKRCVIFGSEFNETSIVATTDAFLVPKLFGTAFLVPNYCKMNGC